MKIYINVRTKPPIIKEIIKENVQYLNICLEQENYINIYKMCQHKIYILAQT